MLKPKKERFFINVGLGFQSVFVSKDYFTFTQSTRTINQTKKSGISLNLIIPFDFNIRITENLAIGAFIGTTLFSKYLVLGNSLNLDPDNPLNRNYFRDSNHRNFVRITASYFIRK